MNKIKSFLISIMVVASGIILSNAYDYGYNIKNMDVKVEVNDKREYKITETIDVYFNEYRHGIIRKIPMNSSLEKYKINDVVVKGSKYDTIRGSNFEIKIGDPDETLIGDKQYVIEYTLSHYKDNEKDGDYLYLNVLGTQWDTYIEHFASTIIYPEEFEVMDLNITDGYYGSTENNLVTYEAENNIINIYSIDTISPENGVTVNVRFNEGAFSNAPINIKNIFIDIFNILSILLLITAIILVIVSRLKRRDVISIVEFYPPEDLNSVELGYLYSNTIYNESILSLIYCWANKGYLKIKLLENDDFSLTKLKSMDELNDEYERKLFDKIFSYGVGSPKVVVGTQLMHELSRDVNRCKKEVKEKFKNDKRYLKENKQYKWICIISYLLLFASVFLDYNGDMLIFASLKIFTTMFLIAFTKEIIKTECDENKNIIENLFGPKNLLFPILILIALSIMPMAISLQASMVTSLFFENTTIVVVCSLISLIIGKLVISNKSDYEQEVYSRIVGFKDFIEVVEKDKLEMLLEEDPEYFYKILPYAQVLNVTDKWIDKFELIAIPKSSYYDYGYIGNPSIGMYNLDKALNKTGKDMISPKSSSSSDGGFSGGGFSGGGSGGGGGSSW